MSFYGGMIYVFLGELHISDLYFLIRHTVVVFCVIELLKKI